MPNPMFEDAVADPSFEDAIPIGYQPRPTGQLLGEAVGSYLKVAPEMAQVIGQEVGLAKEQAGGAIREGLSSMGEGGQAVLQAYDSARDFGRQVDTNYVRPMMAPLTNAMGRLNKVGNVAAGLGIDLEKGVLNPSTWTNTGMAMINEPLLDEEDLGVVGRGAVNATRMAPTLAAGSLLSRVPGVGPYAMPFVFGLDAYTHSGGDIVEGGKGAAMGYAIPKIMEAGTTGTARALAGTEFGRNLNPTGQKIWETVGGQAAVTGAMEASRVPEYLQMPDGKKDMFLSNLISDLIFAAPGVKNVLSKKTPSQTLRTQYPEGIPDNVYEAETGVRLPNQYSPESLEYWRTNPNNPHNYVPPVAESGVSTTRGTVAGGPNVGEAQAGRPVRVENLDSYQLYDQQFAELQKLSPSASPRLLDKMIHNKEFSDKDFAAWEALPKAEQNAIDRWVNDVGHPLEQARNDVSSLRTREQHIADLEYSDSIPEMIRQMVEKVGHEDVHPQVLQRFLDLMGERGVTPAKAKSEIKYALIQRYGSDAAFMGENFLKAFEQLKTGGVKPYEKPVSDAEQHALDLERVADNEAFMKTYEENRNNRKAAYEEVRQMVSGIGGIDKFKSGEILKRFVSMMNEEGVTPAQAKEQIQNELRNQYGSGAKLGDAAKALVEGDTSNQALGIIPQRVKAFFAKKPKGPPPTTPIDGMKILPDFEDTATTEGYATEKVGFGPLNWVLGTGVRKNALPYERSTARFNLESSQIGVGHARRAANEIKGTINHIFFQDPNGQPGDLNVLPTRAGQSLKPSDVFEELQRDPNAYNLTPEQRQVWDNIITPVLQRTKFLKDYYKTTDVMDEYFPRGTPEGKPPKRGGPGGANLIKIGDGERVYKTEQEGWDKGEKYDMDIEGRLANSFERMYSGIAAKRLINDPSFGGETRAQVEARVTALNPTMTPEEIKSRTDLIMKNGRVRLPLFEQTQKAYSKEVKEHLEGKLWRSSSPEGVLYDQYNKGSKSFILNYDASVLTNQGLGVFATNPKAGGRAAREAIRSIGNPEVMADYVKRKRDTINRMNEFGMVVGGMEEFNTGQSGVSKFFRKFGPLGKGVAAVGDASQRLFQNMMDISKVELFEAMEANTPPQDHYKMARQIENIVGSGRMEGANVSAARANRESKVLLAPSYIRGNLEMLGTLLSGGNPAKQGAKTLGALASMSLAYQAFRGWQEGMDKDEIVATMTPGDPHYMMVRDRETGKWSGLPGFHRSLLQMIGRTVRGTKEDFFNLKENPILRFARDKGAVGVGMLQTAVTGENRDGSDATLGSIVTSHLPQIGKEILQGDLTGIRQAAMGLRMFDASAVTADNVRRKINREKNLNIPELDTLNYQQRHQLELLADEETKQRFKDADPEKIGKEKVKAGQRALETDEFRQSELRRALTPENRRFLKDNLEDVRRWKTTIPKPSMAGMGLPKSITQSGAPSTDVHMTKRERKAFATFIAEETNRALDELRAANPAQITPKNLDVQFDRAKDNAFRRLEAERAKWRAALQQQ